MKGYSIFYKHADRRSNFCVNSDNYQAGLYLCRVIDVNGNLIGEQKFILQKQY